MRLVLLMFVSLLSLLESGMPCAAKTMKGRINSGVGKNISSETSPDHEIERAILKTMPDYIGQSSDRSVDQVRYYYNRVDLDGDGKPEVLVYLTGRAVCGTGGCELLVFRSTSKGYRLVSSILLARNPVIVSRRRTHGWSDIILAVRGGGIVNEHFAVLRFDGREYPDNPTLASRISSKSARAGQAFIADNIPSSPGILLPRTRDN